MVSRCAICALAASLLATFARADEVQFDVPLLSNGFDPIPLSAWRIGALELRDPHVYYSFGVCLDVTDTVNTNVQQQLDADTNGDGIYDSSALELMLPYESGAVRPFGSSDGNCTTAANSCSKPLITRCCGIPPRLRITTQRIFLAATALRKSDSVAIPRWPEHPLHSPRRPR